MSEFLPDHGERAFLCGQTGSGKTLFATWLLERLETAPFIIYDTKEEPKFLGLPNSVLALSWGDVEKHVRNPKFDYVIFRPNPHLTADARALDQLLYLHWANHRDVGAYIDEMYSFTFGTKPGVGITALLTKGRSRGNTTIIGCQRPSWIPGFCITEAQKYYLFHQADLKDRERIAGVIPDFKHSPRLPKHHFFFFKNGDETFRMMKPIKIVDPTSIAGYVDNEASQQGPPPLVWL